MSVQVHNSIHTIEPLSVPLRPQIVIGLVNNMPDGAIRATEIQFDRLLGAASDRVDVRIELYSIPGLPRSPASAELLRSYRSTEELPARKIDALIVTGNEPRAPSLDEEPYWPALTKLIDWANENTLSSIWSCLAAHAAVLYLDGVDRHQFNSKLSGIFECERISDHPLVHDMPAAWEVPHSRLYGLATDDLVAKGYMPLTVSKDAGTDLFVKQGRSLFVFFQGHLEYNSNSLMKEYIRDVGRYIGGERDVYPELPRNYFDADTVEKFEKIRNQALEFRKIGLRGPAEIGTVKQAPVNRWTEPASRVYRNWLLWLVQRKAERDGSSAAPVDSRLDLSS